MSFIAKIPTSTTKCQDQNPLDIAVSIPITIVAMLSLAVGLIIYRRKKPPLPAVSQGRYITFSLYCEFFDDLKCFEVAKNFAIYEGL